MPSINPYSNSSGEYFYLDDNPSVPDGNSFPTRLPYTTFQKFAYGSLAVLGMATGTVLTVAGGVLGMAAVYHMYLNTQIGQKIFKVYTRIFFFVGSGLGASAAAVATINDPWAKLFSLFLASCSTFCFVTPFFPILFGAVGGYPGYQLTRLSHNFFNEVVYN